MELFVKYIVSSVANQRTAFVMLVTFIDYLCPHFDTAVLYTILLFSNTSHFIPSSLAGSTLLVISFLHFTVHELRSRDQPTTG